MALARNALGLGNTEGALPIANGGTGATNAAAARTNLGIAPGGDSPITAIETPAAFANNPEHNWAGITANARWARIHVTSVPNDLTGITGGVHGRRLLLSNVGTLSITLIHNGSSTAENRFLCPGNFNRTLTAGSSVELVYDGINSRWRVLG